MACTATMSPAGYFASQFVAERPHTTARFRVRQLLRRFVRAFETMGLALDGAYAPASGTR